MSDKRKHRGSHPKDKLDFSAQSIQALRAAEEDLALLFEKGYAQKSALKLVGDRYQLTTRQRTAVLRIACSHSEYKSRKSRQVSPEKIRGGGLLEIDGYNLLISIEAALSNGIILCGRDGTFRDMASVHGNYRSVSETIPALKLAGNYLAHHSIDRVRWWLDKPVSNSGKLKGLILQLAKESNWNWEVALTPDPDVILKKTPEIIASSDSAILDDCGPWLNLARHIIEAKVPEAWIIDLSGRLGTTT